MTRVTARRGRTRRTGKEPHPTREERMARAARVPELMPILYGGWGRRPMVNAWWQPLEFVIPPTREGQVSEPELDSFEPTGLRTPAKFGAGDAVTVKSRSVMVLRGPVTGHAPDSPR